MARSASGDGRRKGHWSRDIAGPDKPAANVNKDGRRRKRMKPSNAVSTSVPPQERPVNR